MYKGEFPVFWVASYRPANDVLGYSDCLELGVNSTYEVDGFVLQKSLKISAECNEVTLNKGTNSGSLASTLSWVSPTRLSRFKTRVSCRWKISELLTPVLSLDAVTKGSACAGLMPCSLTRQRANVGSRPTYRDVQKP